MVWKNFSENSRFIVNKAFDMSLQAAVPAGKSNTLWFIGNCGLICHQKGNALIKKTVAPESQIAFSYSQSGKMFRLACMMVVPVAVAAGCGGSNNGPSPQPTATAIPSGTPAATPIATPTAIPSGVACTTGAGDAVFANSTTGSFNSAAFSSACARGEGFTAQNAVRAVTLFVEDTRAGENRTLVFLVNDPNGFRTNFSYRLVADTPSFGSYLETSRSSGTAEAWNVSNGTIVFEAITPTSIRYRFQANFRPRTSSRANIRPGTGNFSLAGTATSSLADGIQTSRKSN